MTAWGQRTLRAGSWWDRGLVLDRLVLVLLLVFSIGAVFLVFRVRQLRVEVETRVGWLTSLQEGVRALDQEEETSRATALLEGTASEIERTPAIDPSLTRAAAELRVVLGTLRSRPDTKAGTEVRGAVDTVVRGVRGETALISRKLGDLWSYLYALVGASLGLALATFLLLRLWQRARLQAAERARDAAEAKLLHADRLVAIGTLSAAVAHEINNPIATVLLNLQLLEHWVEAVGCDARTRAEGQELTADAILGVERVAAIVKDMRMFAHIEEGAAEAVDVRVPLEAALRLLKPVLGGVVIEEFAEAPRVRAISRRLEQVFVNLLINALHAMESTERSSELSVTLDTTPDGQVRVRIEDNGCGVPDEIAEQAGQAFVTTKPVGRGTGLGLFVSRAIVGGLGGAMTLTKRPAGGTTATVLLPAAEHRTPDRSGPEEHVASVEFVGVPGSLRVKATA